MKAEKWLILGALAGLAGIAINKQLRIARHRLELEDEQPDAQGRSSIDDVPDDVPTIQAAAEGRAAEGQTTEYDDRVAPGAPL